MSVKSYGGHVYAHMSIIWHLKQIYIDLIQKINVFIQIVSDNGDGRYNLKIKTLLFKANILYYFGVN